MSKQKNLAMKTRNIYERNSKPFKLAVVLIMNLLIFNSYAQVTGDYRTRSGATTWNSSTSWQRFNGSTFVNYATPPSSSFLKKITILHSITFDVSANVATLEIKDGATVTLSQSLAISGELSLTGGTLDLNGNTLTMADGTTIYRVAGSLSASPSFDGAVNVTYNEHTSEIQTGYELPSDASKLMDLIIWSSNGVKLTKNITVNNSLSLNSGNFNLNSNSLTMADATTIYRSSGSISAAPTFGSTVNVYYDEHSSEIQTGYELPTGSTVLTNLTIGNSNNVALDKTTTVNGTLDLLSGKITIGTHNLVIASTGTITNYSSSQFIVAGDGIYRSTAGKVVRFINSSTAAGDQIFPVGTTTSYTPCYIANSNSSGTDFRVNLFDEVLENGDEGTPLTGGVLNRTWSIVPDNSSNASGSTTIKIQWISSDQTLNFSLLTLSLIRNAGTSGSSYENATGTFSNETSSEPYKMQSAGVTEFGYFTGKGGDLETGGTLPVSLVEFKSECNNGKQNIIWTTTSEVNNDFFMVEKSDDANNWEVLGMIPGSGNSNEMLTYNLLDRNENKGSCYYRLKQIDYNGLYTYSKIISSENCFYASQQKTSVFPNPFSNNISVINYSDKDEITYVSVFDASGKTVYKTEYLSNEGANSNSLDLKPLKNGVYYLKFENGDKTENFKVLKQ